MKLYFFYALSIFFTLASCKNDKLDTKKKESKYLDIYSEEDFQRKVKIIDTFCITLTKQAEQDIRKGKLSINMSYLYHLDRPLLNEKHLDYKIKLTPHLEKFNIRLDTTFSLPPSDIIGPFDDLFGINCYKKKMKIEIEKRHGEYFLDSLVDVVEKEYKLKHGDKTVDESIINYYRTKQQLYYEKYISKYEAEFEKKFKYPKEYKFKNEKEYSYSNAVFTLSKDGTVRNLDIKSVFINPDNQKFKTYFEDELRKFILKTKWEIPRTEGRRVSNEMNLIIFHK